ncbi:glucan biosynthesis protein [Ovoidimarina sediminis]|uniref:glucan biosynthesis protein n=1 Tax=Ovoidimarina sediminis TaxID=3079856 RepID=UPI0039778308
MLAVLAAAALAPRAGADPVFKGAARPFSEDWLEAEARRLSMATYQPRPQVPQGWRDLTYEQYRSMWFDPRNALWNDTDAPFKIDFFHPGLYFPRAVEINVIENGEARTLAFDPTLFDKTDKFPDLPVDATMGYSGLRLRAALQKAGVFTEFAVFQGASYFRGIGRGQTYGLSARGLAVNTAEPAGEEFPEFTRFWLETPAPGDPQMVVHALLDGPSVAGAYRFAITPGLPMTMQVSARLYPRIPLEHVGIAPLTSMFFFDETNRAGHDDFRSAVHDSDGLMIHNGAGELLWRPLANPARLQVSSFVDDGPSGFGLMQRSRAFEAFGDLEAKYHDRPSLWITPGEDWGPGAVTLVEIPTDLEIYDNIVAYWRPRMALDSGMAHRFSYQMSWGGEPPRPRAVAPVLNTRIGGNFDRSKTLVVIDFADHPNLRGDIDTLVKHVSSNRGKVSDGVLKQNPETGGLRLTFSFDPGKAPAVELRAQLVRDGRSQTEVWLYRWTAP